LWNYVGLFPQTDIPTKKKTHIVEENHNGKNLSLRKNITGWERKMGRKKSFKDIPCENPES